MPTAVDEHGRRLSTTGAAASLYRAAQRAVPAIDSVRRALREALDADPGFVIADAALAALELGERGTNGSPGTSWERRHIDIVAGARSTQPERAVDLLRDHLLDVGCDPIASLVVSAFVKPGEVTDLLADAPRCHAWTPKHP